MLPFVGFSDLKVTLCARGRIVMQAGWINGPIDRKDVLIAKCGQVGYEKLSSLENPVVMDFVSRYLAYCNPDRAFVRTGSQEDAAYIRRRSIERGEERELRIRGHTVHHDGYHDQARDRENTKFLLRPDEKLGPKFNSIVRETGLKEIHGYLRDIMRGKQAYVCFFSLGPQKSPFSIPALQITDSAYVAHSEDIMYRDGCELFRIAPFRGEEEFFKFIHSAGKLDIGNSNNLHERRIYTDVETNTIFSTNTQYGGNTIGPKKLGMRLAIRKAAREGWLTEHMFIVGVHGPRNRVSYFAGAFPSACGKTSTSMIEGETLVGDDIAYLREVDGEMRGINPERGIFGIIRDVNPDDDPLIWRALKTPGEVIMSNVLVCNGKPYWIGMGETIPDQGFNHSGRWRNGKKDEKGVVIDPAHRNARYMLRISDLANMDPNLENPEGVRIDGVIYGARDADTWLPVEESFSWRHGVTTKAAVLESETTSATLGKSGLRTFNPMANIDFLSIPIGKYIESHLRFGEKLTQPPRIFSANYFLKDQKGRYLNDTQDKRVWLKWRELRAHGDVGVVITPTGYAPTYGVLRVLFKDLLGKDYSWLDYERQFTVRIRENLMKIDRMINLFGKEVHDAPQVLLTELENQRIRLEEVGTELGNYVSPRNLEIRGSGDLREGRVKSVEVSLPQECIGSLWISTRR